MVVQNTSPVPKMGGTHINARHITLMRVMFCLALCALIGGLAPLAAASYRDTMASPQANTPGPDAPQATYRAISQRDGATQVQRSTDAGRTWADAGMVPERVLQLVSNPVNDNVVFARTGTNVWRSETGGANWTSVASLPGRPLALTMTGHSDPSGVLFLGTDTQGLYTSLDSGRTWQTAGGRLSQVGAGSLAISALAVSPGDEQVVYAAATFSMATPQGLHSIQLAFISVDDGRHWFEMTPAQRLEHSITQLTPLAGPLLAVLIPGALGTQVVGLDVGLPFAAGLSASDPSLRAATARTIGFSRNRALLPILLLHLRDPDLFAGDQVAEAIGRLGDAAAAPLLMPLLSDADEAIRGRAATALGWLHLEEAIPPLGAMLRHDGPWAGRHAAEALAAIGTPAAMAALTAPLADQPMTPARHAAMGALEKAGQPAVTAVVAALNDSSAVVRTNAAEMLGWLKPPSAVADLARLLADPDPAVQAQAAWALSEINTEPARLALNPAPAALLVAPVPPAAVVMPADAWTLAAMVALLLLGLLAIVLIWKGPRPTSHLGHT